MRTWRVVILGVNHNLCVSNYHTCQETLVVKLDVCLFQVINKIGDTPFTQQDEQVFSSYLQFCGIGLRNAHLYETSQLEVKRNQVLLDLARMIFEEQSTIEHVVYRILTHTQSLIQCQRVQVTYPQFDLLQLDAMTIISRRYVEIFIRTLTKLTFLISLHSSRCHFAWFCL